VRTFRSAVCGRPEGLHYISLSAFRERGVDEAVRRGRSDTGPDNRQEIVSEIRQ
jgi:hypothetical protein